MFCFDIELFELTYELLTAHVANFLVFYFICEEFVVCNVECLDELVI